MKYKGFDIIKKKPGLYWVIYNGSMIGSAVSVEVAKEYIDELTTCYLCVLHPHRFGKRWGSYV